VGDEQWEFYAQVVNHHATYTGYDEVVTKSGTKANITGGDHFVSNKDLKSNTTAFFGTPDIWYASVGELLLEGVPLEEQEPESSFTVLETDGEILGDYFDYVVTWSGQSASGDYLYFKPVWYGLNSVVPLFIKGQYNFNYPLAVSGSYNFSYRYTNAIQYAPMFLISECEILSGEDFPDCNYEVAFAPELDFRGQSLGSEPIVITGTGTITNTGSYVNDGDTITANWEIACGSGSITEAFWYYGYPETSVYYGSGVVLNASGSYASGSVSWVANGSDTWSLTPHATYVCDHVIKSLYIGGFNRPIDTVLIRPDIVGTLSGSAIGTIPIVPSSVSYILRDSLNGIIANLGVWPVVTSLLPWTYNWIFGISNYIEEVVIPATPIGMIKGMILPSAGSYEIPLKVFDSPLPEQLAGKSYEVVWTTDPVLPNSILAGLMFMLVLFYSLKIFRQ